MKLPPAYAQQLATLRTRWAGLPPREQRLLLLAAGAIFLLLLWWIALRPAVRTLIEVPAKARAQEATWMQMQAMAAETRELRALPPVNAAQSTAALNAATARLGHRGQLVVTGERATLKIANATPEDLRNWLTEVRSGARARAIEMQISRNGNALNGQVVVVLPAPS